MSYYPPISIKQAIDKIDYSQYLLPAIQREFVWSSDQIELLFDSLMRNYPIGSLLMWKVQGDNKTDHRYYSVLKNYREKYNTHCEEINTNTINDFEAVLDGQQRLTALYIGLKGSLNDLSARPGQVIFIINELTSFTTLPSECRKTLKHHFYNAFLPECRTIHNP